MAKQLVATTSDDHQGARMEHRKVSVEGDGSRRQSTGHGRCQPQWDGGAGTANVEGNNILGLSFPRTLWRIVEYNAFTSLCSNDDGDTVIIEENLFQREILCRRGEEQTFESKSLKSFIRLLNHHGLNKICPGNSSVCFPGNKIMRKKKMAPTRHSPRIHHEDGSKEAEQKAQETGKNDWGPNATQAFEFSVPQPMGSAREVQCPSAASSSSGEGTSGNVMFVPRATARTDGTGDLSSTPPNEPLQVSVMSLYNICYSTLITGLSVMAPSEDPDQAEEEQEGSSDNKCSVCEQFKDNAGP
ncbi:heat shock transcription factor, X-linked member 3-like [Myotis lucifugus]|uniref:heat shock transcription factor, X-linked member 3-like n=1 Tax=Myotis lucifugus TaxID=59463 RepID=UPI000CCC14E3|nr:heat shock transcription factor, X-linked member 3-like [Myotis lucifugus]